MGTQAEFYGSGRRQSISADLKLTRHAGPGSAWSWQITATSSGLAVQLPDARTIDSTGYPVIQIVNEGTNTFAIEDADGTELIATGDNPQTTVFTFALFNRTTKAGDWEWGEWVQGSAAGPGATIKPWTLGGTGTSLEDKAWEFDFVADSWAQAVATAANTHSRSAGFAVQGEGYIVGSSGALDAFDPSAWNGGLTDRDISGANAWGIAHETDDKGYVFGADVADTLDSKSVDEYDVSGDAWTAKTDMGDFWWKASGATGASNKLYYHGGANTFGAGSHDALTTIGVYDITGDSHDVGLTSSTIKRLHHMTVADGDQDVWAYAGRTSGPAGASQDDVEKYDVSGDSWSTKIDMPQGDNAEGGAARISLNGFTYTVGGQTTAGNSDAVYQHTPGNDTYVAQTDHAASGDVTGVSQGGVMPLDI